LTAPFEKVIDPGFITGTALPTVAGFAGTHIVAYQGAKLLGIGYTGFGKHLSRLAASALVSGAGGLLTKDSAVAANMLVGGMVATLAGIVEELLGTTLTSLGVPSERGGLMGAAEDEEMKAIIAEAVRSQVQGGMSDYATAQAIGAAPRLADYMTEEAMQAAPQLSGGMGNVAHFSQVVDQEADSALV
jgi:hypothetical protein